jgi:hypothetical protein
MNFHIRVADCVLRQGPGGAEVKRVQLNSMRYLGVHPT